MKSIALFLALFGLVYADLSFPSIGDVGDECRTPNGSPGNCIDITQCPLLMDLVSKKPVSPENTILLQQSTCGFEGSNPLVCCPTSSPTRGGTFEGHRNRRLFPSYPLCGRSNIPIQNPTAGENPQPGQYPWSALLGYTSRDEQFNWRCGGTLISNRYVLTAAHCVTGPTGRLPLVRVRLGEHVISNGGLDCVGDTCLPLPQDYDVASAPPHPSYNMTVGIINDIALIRLRNPVIFSDSVRPICLPFDKDPNTPDDIDNTQQVIYMTGWGSLGFPNATTSDVLRSTRVSVVPISNCANLYGNRVQLGSLQVCTGGVPGQGRCGADSGATLMLAEPNNRFQVVGVVSRGQDNCTDTNVPVVHARVGAYLQWILDTVNP